MCLNIGLGFMEIPDTPLSMPDHYGDCGAQYEASVGDGGMVKKLTLCIIKIPICNHIHT